MHLVLVHDRKLLTHLDTSQISEAKSFAKWTKIVICIALVVAFAFAELTASIVLIQSGAPVELTSY